MDPGTVLAVVNARDGSTWPELGPVPGGYQQGVTAVVDAHGRRGALKVVPTGWSTEQIGCTAALVERARRAGWPTPAWLAYGRHGDAFYQLTEFVDGAPLKGLDDPTLAGIIHVLETQAGISGPTAQNWSDYVNRAVAPGSHLLGELRSASATAEGFADALADLCAGLAPVDFGAGGLVHGDVSLENFLDSDGTLMLVDTNAVGVGHRVIDYASLIRQCWAWDVDSRHRDQLLAAARAIAADDAVTVALCARMVDVLCFIAGRWPDRVDAVVRRFRPLLRELER